ncbi:FkbM family methyltransferase, partial [Candidatus Thioglobus sp.]|nr:FkbM family methyltransferase [Candidatus Thioglobus sp.]
MSFNDIFEEIKNSPNKHPRGCEDYKKIESKLLEIVKKSGFVLGGSGKDSYGPFGEISLPYFKMGAIDSLDLFGLDEMIIFSYYFNNRNRYKKVADLGANIGLHSMLMSKSGFQIEAYEPDPTHIEMIGKNFKLNSVSSVNLNQVAVSDTNRKTKFVRVLGNTTSSHIAGAKDNAYGDLETYDVDVVSAKEIFKNSDFIKMDVEGEEAKIILSTTKEDWKNVDMIMEVGN